MVKKPLILISLCAVVLLILGSLSNVVGYQSVKSTTINDSPLFQTRTQRATNQRQNILTSQYLGMGEGNLLQFPIQDNRTNQLKKVIDMISEMDDESFERFTKLCLQRIRQDDTLRETNSDIIRILYLMRTQPDLIVHSFMNKGNRNITSSNQHTICDWLPGCILYDIVILLEIVMIFVIIFVTAIMSCVISCAASICCKNYNIKLNLY